MTVDDLTDDELRDAVMRLRGITDHTALDPAALKEVIALVRAVELIVSFDDDQCKVSARIPGGVGPFNGWITEVNECPMRAMFRAYLKAINWPNCEVQVGTVSASPAIQLP